MSALSDRPQEPIVGLPEPHESAVGHVTGSALYTDDIATLRQDALIAWPVQSTASARAHHGPAHRSSTDRTRSGQSPDRRRRTRPERAGIWGDEPLFPSEVMYYGHPMCWVLAESAEAARLGAAAVEVEYETLPSIITITEAIEAGSFQGAHRVSRRGDIDAALATAPHVFEGAIETGLQEHFYLETQASLAYYDEGGQMYVQSSTQGPASAQAIITQVLGLPSNAVTVQSLRMGGGFGGKETQPHGFAAIAALGAMVTGRPVRLRLNRTAGHHHHRQTARLPAGLEGRFRRQRQARRLEGQHDGGWRLVPRPHGSSPLPRALPHRQRVLDPGDRGARPHRQDEQDLTNRLPWLRWAAGDSPDRGCVRQVCAGARNRSRRTAAS